MVKLAALAGAVVLATVVAGRCAPAGLLPGPARPFEEHGTSEVRVEAMPYPRHATGADNERTTVAGVPRRLVSQWWSTDEYLYSIVPPERVVGVSDSAGQQQFSNVADVVERYKPAVALDPERVLRATPDLVFTPAEARSDVPGLLRAAGVPVYRIYTVFPTLASIEEHIGLVGYLTGEDARAEAELRRFRDAVGRAAARRPAGSPPPRVMGFGGQYSYGSETLFNDILRVLGAENVAAMHGLIGYDRATDEHIVRWNPDWIIAGADRGMVDQVRARLLAQPAIAATTAAARNQIVVLENNVFLPLSPFTSQLVEAIAAALYGKAS